MTRKHGRAKKGERLNYPISQTWKSKTMLSSVRANGKTACMVLDGAVDGIAFQKYIKLVLIPTLKPNDIVILDNCSVHKD